MDFIKKISGHDNDTHGSTNNHGSTKSSEMAGSSSSKGSIMNRMGDKFNTAAGGGRESEKNEDYLDKAVDMVQEKLLGQGKQDNESAFEQAKDEKISDFVRKEFKGLTGKEIPIKDKKTKFG
ncbi:hypothetical protein BGHDH14_bgh01262 [Blumeria hordei DH14]|uniref:Uncharacterized protein n=1 Tax=Blumeria graminis f. sp. hordei (strain DH14) TaxID=546991 RepID=N1J5L9_BLUG1|nr:hypothetical protein BGHDH14_bgh01262 [Blumeria hordei DH14]